MRPINFCPQCGTRLEQRVLGDRVRPVCPACGFIYYLNPVVAAGTLVERDGQVVLVRRGVEPGKGLWGLPAGYVEADESTEEAAIRETFEESGLVVELDSLLGVYSFGQDTDLRGVLILYSARLANEAENTLRAGDDAIEVAWFAPETLPPDDEIAFWTHRQALHQWRRARTIYYRLATPQQATLAQQMCQAYGLPGRNLQADAAGHHSALIVALDQETVIGYASVTVHRSGRQARLHQVFVLPHHRRWGIGTRLIEQAVAFARGQKVDSLLAKVDADNKGIGAYLKAGFHVSGFLSTPGASNHSPVLFLTHDLSEL